MKSPAFSFYPKDYESDENVKLMTLEQEGAYLRLLCHSWLHGSIPDDVEALALICRVTVRRMESLWPKVKPCWIPSGTGRLVNGRQERERQQQKARKAEASEKGKKGADKRWHSDSYSHKPAKDQLMPGDGIPSAIASTSAFATDRKEKEPPPNPLMGDRQERERECLRLTAQLAERDGLDPVEVFAQVSTWKGVSKVNPAGLRDDRLLHVIRELRRRLDRKPEPEIPKPTPNDWEAARKRREESRGE